MTRGEPLVELESVRYRYRSARTWALLELSQSVQRGIVMGLVGPNGSGKTTLFRLMLGFIRPTDGRVLIAGAKPAVYRARHGIGYLPEAVNLPEQVRVRELANYAARLSGLVGSAAVAAIARLMDELEVAETASADIATLSHGYRQRIALLITLLGDPDLLLLDEPANGLDPDSIGVLRSQLRSLRRRGTTVIVSSHNLLELQRVCDEVLILNEGAVLGRSSRQELLKRSDVWVLQLRPDLDDDDASRIRQRLLQCGGVRLAADEFAFDREARARRCAADASAVELIERRPFDLEFFFHALLQQKNRHASP